MLKTLSRLITQSALEDEKVMILSADHGYDLFNEVRKERPRQFLNVGIAEQAMIGIASGLAKQGFRPIVYGLAAFMPMRCLEQIKLDLCYFNLQVLMIGSGAGLVYSHLGPSHQCAEDLACLMPMPNMRIYTPADKWDLKDTWQDAWKSPGPSYLRLGQCLHPEVSTSSQTEYLGGRALHIGDPLFPLLFSHGSMVYPSLQIARELNLSLHSITRIKPFPEGYQNVLKKTFNLRSIVIEEVSPYGGLSSLIPGCTAITLKDQFSIQCGDYQYALGEQGMDHETLKKRVKDLL